MPLWYSLAWSTRGISAAINAVFLGYISFYASDVLGLNVTIIGTMLLGSKIIDACTDLCMGVIVDKTKTRFGKGRPYEIFIIFEWLITIAMYSVPAGMATMGKYVWLFVTYVLINAVCSTALGAVDSVYMARCFTSDKNRISAMSVNGTVVMLCSIIFSIIFPQFVDSAGTDTSAWAQLAVFLGIPLALIGILRFLICKEVPVDEAAEAETEKANTEKSKSSEKVGLVDLLKIVLRNKYLYFLVGFMFITNIINNIGTATTYYFKYIVGNFGLMSLANMTGLMTPVVLVFFPLLARKFGTTRLLRIGMAMGVIGIGIRTIGGANMGIILLGSLCSSVAVLPISMMINTYLIDTMDYGEWETCVGSCHAATVLREDVRQQVRAAIIAQTIAYNEGLVEGYSFWTVSDIFEEMGLKPGVFKNEVGIQTMDGIPKPSYQIFKILHEAGARRLPVDGTPHRTAEVLALTDGAQITILAYNHDISRLDVKPEEMAITLEGEISSIHKAVIDEDHTNPQGVWQGMGSPVYLSRRQTAQLRDAAQLVYEPVGVEDGPAQTLRFTAQPESVTIFRVQRK